MPSGGAPWAVRTRDVIGAGCMAVVLVLGGCGGATCGTGSGDDGGTDSDAGRDAGMPVAPEVIIGIPGDPDGLEFVPLEAGGDIALETFGQGGTHAELAVRAVGFGRRAYIVVTLENLASGETVMSPEPARPQLLLCRDEADTTCDLIPFLVLTGGLADPSEKDGLRILVTAEARNDDGVEGSASIEGVLRAP